QIQIDAGVDAKMFCGAWAGDHVAELSLNVVRKIRRVRYVDSSLGRGHLKRRLLGLISFFAGDLAGFRHVVQHLIPARGCSVDISIRVITIRTTNYSRQES